jgi:hypothetical protein
MKPSPLELLKSFIILVFIIALIIGVGLPVVGFIAKIAWNALVWGFNFVA